MNNERLAGTIRWLALSVVGVLFTTSVGIGTQSVLDVAGLALAKTGRDPLRDYLLIASQNAEDPSILVGAMISALPPYRFAASMVAVVVTFVGFAWKYGALTFLRNPLVLGWSSLPTAVGSLLACPLAIVVTGRFFAWIRDYRGSGKA